MNSADRQKLPMQSDPGAGTTSKLEQESLLPELLHALNQPLTSLRCSLELTLLQPRDSDEYRNRLRESLRLTEDIVVLSSGIRELLDVEQPGGSPTRVAFDRVLESSVRELLPLAEAQDIRVELTCLPSLAVLGDSQRYLAALLHFLGFLLSFAQKDDELTIRAGVEGNWVALSMLLEKREKNGTKLPSDCAESHGSAKSYLRLLIARRIFEVEGGNVFVERENQRIRLSVKLPFLQEPERVKSVPGQSEPAPAECLPQSA